MSHDASPQHVIPAKAGIQTAFVQGSVSDWIPAFAGMTKRAAARMAS
jgi:hypothetical protein